MRDEIEALLVEGLSQNEIAVRLGLAGPTVNYHVSRIRSTSSRDGAPSQHEPVPRARTQILTRRRVAELLTTGLSRVEVAKRLGLSKATVSYHAKRLGAPVDARCARRYDWAAIQGYYDRGHSVRECKAQFGFSSHSWHAAVGRGAIVPRPSRLPSDEYFVAGLHRNRYHVKKRLVKEGHKEGRCASCGIRQWQGRSLSFALHHINGDRYDNRVVNLELLCPNCHSQTDNFAGRNGHRQRAIPVATE